MSKVSHKLLGTDGKEAGTVELNSEIVDCEDNESLVHDTVVWQRAKKRAGTHSALRKSEVTGGGKKPFKQKGTGQARAGSNTSPLWVGGGVSHGPKPRDYTSRLPKRTRKQALCSVLTFKRLNDKLIVLNSLDVSSGKTKDMVSVLKKLNIYGESAAIVVSSAKDNQANVNLMRASRNIPGLEAINADGVNVYDLLKHKYLITTIDAISSIENRLNK